MVVFDGSGFGFLGGFEGLLFLEGGDLGLEVGVLCLEGLGDGGGLFEAFFEDEFDLVGGFYVFVEECLDFGLRA